MQLHILRAENAERQKETALSFHVRNVRGKPTTFHSQRSDRQMQIQKLLIAANASESGKLTNLKDTRISNSSCVSQQIAAWMKIIMIIAMATAAAAVDDDEGASSGKRQEAGEGGHN